MPKGKLERADFADGQSIVFHYDPQTRKASGYLADGLDWTAGVDWQLNSRGLIGQEALTFGEELRQRSYEYEERGFLDSAADELSTCGLHLLPDRDSRLDRGREGRAVFRAGGPRGSGRRPLLCLRRARAGDSPGRPRALLRSDGAARSGRTGRQTVGIHLRRSGQPPGQVGRGPARCGLCLWRVPHRGRVRVAARACGSGGGSRPGWRARASGDRPPRDAARRGG